MPPMTNQEIYDMYSSEYHCDYYDCVVGDVVPVSDAGVYRQAFQQMHILRAQKSQQPDPADRYLVLDIGTGSGRVLNDLAATEGHSLHTTDLMGIDNSQYMLDRAEARALAGRISWVLHSAFDLESLVAGREVDLLIFAIGSIGHFHAPAQSERFLEQVGCVLRPGSGRAYISIRDCCFMENATLGGQEKGVMEVASKTFPGVLYRGELVDVRVEGRVRFDRCTFQAFRMDARGREVTLEENDYWTTMRLWEKGELAVMASGYGLVVVDTVKAIDETIFVLRKEPSMATL
ncbi:S-adenosyl-L-methionine-dependent methyltransferase [Aspergillus coremiiformis]|uniref:S-adenosyl-L-methionine-dependent methyltransferase n=1 Tax=Aspergillus coremiiformis TaxID=138285 RepID=A0A5N6ZDY5_9EURO|nr:S-adenosyl-L-methionine-dependent methyltransferase [Aspergillus coremiiformis]